MSRFSNVVFNVKKSTTRPEIINSLQFQLRSYHCGFYYIVFIHEFSSSTNNRYVYSQMIRRPCGCAVVILRMPMTQAIVSSTRITLHRYKLHYIVDLLLGYLQGRECCGALISLIGTQDATNMRRVICCWLVCMQ